MQYDVKWNRYLHIIFLKILLLKYRISQGLIVSRDLKLYILLKKYFKTIK